MGVECDGGKISKQAAMWKRKYLSKGKGDPKVEEDPKGFLLGEGTLKKKMHLLNWLTVYMDNKNGSLSIRRLNEEFSVGDLLRKNFPLEASDCKEVWGRREGMSLTGHEEDMWWDCIRQLEAGMGIVFSYVVFYSHHQRRISGRSVRVFWGGGLFETLDSQDRSMTRS
ncbi:hypothetical protein CK203_102380 [Vitis vinifera]|uniref:Uncharacterized protein n=1 Tax=Vitis vinifera TaxID=29760 RepID=A0A438DNJ2_VITVI|nr:hypothetical protein CK203_102380 [Vitis vinifera]